MCETTAPRQEERGTAPLSIATLAEVPAEAARRLPTGMSELDTLLGGGIVPGSAVLIGGEPGIGKSTLLLQTAAAVAASGKQVLYGSAEESLSQIKLRAARLGIRQENIFLVAGGMLEHIQEAFRKLRPDVLIVDSIQTVHTTSLPGAPGTLSQVRECAAVLTDAVRESGAALFLAGHVTKDGALAGPKTLEHMVDTVLYFEGSRDREVRILRSFKNRFGNVNEIGVFLMRQEGLLEVHDPEGLFVDKLSAPGPGAALTAALEGNRVLLAEIQALVTGGGGGAPGRMVDGIEPARALRIKAIIDHASGIGLGEKDVFVNVAGGLSIREPAVDLAIAMAMTSSARGIPVGREAVFLGELSLLGDLRRISQCEKRIQQAKKLGIPTVVLPEANRKDCAGIAGIELVFIATLRDATAAVF